MAKLGAMHKYFSLSALVLALDQLTKAYAEHMLDLYESINILPFFSFTLVYNHGAAFGFLADQGGWQKWFLLILTILITGFLIRWIKRLEPHEKFTAIALCLILGGALGNIIDRAIYGYVIDFVDIYIGSRHWPAFNIADSAISIGAGFLIFDTFLNKSANR